MILSNKKTNYHKINSILGESIPVDIKNPKPVGSPKLYLKLFKNNRGSEGHIELNSVCNIERRPQGLLLHTNFSNKRTFMLIPKNEVLEIKIIRGKEKIDPFFLSPMWILLKLKVPIRYARYFGLRLPEYSIDQMKLSIRTTGFEMDFISSGYSFEGHLDFLKRLNLGDKLKVEIKANT